MHSHDVSSDDLVGEAGEDQSECFTRTQDLAQDTKGVFRTLCFARRVYHVNKLVNSRSYVDAIVPPSIFPYRYSPALGREWNRLE